jgi:F0F1-type ATP synthase assembly protein I
MISKKKNKPPLSSYAQVSTAIIEMILVITGFVYAGTWLDAKQFINFPLFTIVLSLLGVGIAMYLLIRVFVKKEDKK